MPCQIQYVVHLSIFFNLPFPIFICHVCLSYSLYIWIYFVLQNFSYHQVCIIIVINHIFSYLISILCNRAGRQVSALLRLLWCQFQAISHYHTLYYIVIWYDIFTIIMIQSQLIEAIKMSIKPHIYYKYFTMVKSHVTTRPILIIAWIIKGECSVFLNFFLLYGWKRCIIRIK